MPSPFPGMDPYIEHPDIWQDFHHDLAAEIQGQLSPRIRPRYYAAIEVFVTYDDTESGDARKGRPDVGVVLRETQTAYPVLFTDGPSPVESRVALDPLKLFTVEIRAANDRQLITSIELLSPVNKQRGHKAFESYHRKRQAVLNSDTHLIEIDLLRDGERPPLLDPVPPASYYIILSRIEKRPTVQVWPIQLKDKLPVLPVPLRKPDPDVILDLNAAVAAIYERAAYAVRIDYHQPPPPPEWSPEERAWVESLLKREKQNA